MSWQRVNPARLCVDCGAKVSNSGVLRCRPCFKIARRGPGNPNWLGSEASKAGMHARARRWYPTLDECEHDGCSKPPYDRHHVDGDVTNNSPENVRQLCRQHHMEEDGRLEKLLEYAKSYESRHHTKGQRRKKAK